VAFSIHWVEEMNLPHLSQYQLIYVPGPVAVHPLRRKPKDSKDMVEFVQVTAVPRFAGEQMVSHHWFEGTAPTELINFLIAMYPRSKADLTKAFYQFVAVDRKRAKENRSLFKGIW
jgi:hypothetical protein